MNVPTTQTGRVKAWRRRRWVKTPLLWAVALLGAGLAWIARER